MSQPSTPHFPSIRLARSEVFPQDKSARGSELYCEISDWTNPITFFVGRNGAGKSRTARAVSRRIPGGRFLETDRLVTMMSFSHYSWGVHPKEDFKGIPLGDSDRQQMKSVTANVHSASDELYTMREQPDIWIKVVSFLKRALGRTIQLRESSGFLDPYVQIENIEYSLFRDEGHGLRELVILLAAAYRDDWSLLVVDEPELHLHPSMARLWLGELRRECIERDKRAIIVTHEPSLLRMRDAEDLKSVWHFQANSSPRRFFQDIHEGNQSAANERYLTRASATLKTNPDIVSQLVFSPRPVLVEGVHDVAALSATLDRTQPAEVVTQTDLVFCGGSAEVALWFEIADSMGIDVRAIADLDACLENSVQRVMDSRDEVTRKYREELFQEPPRTSEILKPLIAEMTKLGVPKSPKERANWLAQSVPEGTAHYARKQKLLEIWRENGLWLHPQGTIENVLGIETKGINNASEAASNPGEIDAVASWCAYDLNPSGDIELLLNLAVERVAHAIMEAIGASPGSKFYAPVGPSALADGRLVDVVPKEGEFHRIVVKTPKPFQGYWLEFSRETPSSQLKLNPPNDSP
ncbi:AAA family ATPase [Streptomyces sp. NBC_00111]|uniref:ATP-dependent nuclease n=1 Tax=Streptomyces sp. NBC_00111 TaxID=2975655 RepID=UPI0032541ADF